MDMNTEAQYMVDFTLPEVIDEEFMNLIPYQRIAINKLFVEGSIISYSLSLEKSKLWAIFKASTELDLMDMIADLPLTCFMDIEISPLTFHNITEPELPEFSMN